LTVFTERQIDIAGASPETVSPQCCQQ